MAIGNNPKLLSLCFLLFFVHCAYAQQLSTSFYYKTCPNMETIVKKTTAGFISRAPSLAAALLRMHFHDCFVRGCEGSVLLKSANNTAERDSFPNLSLRGFQVIDAVKSAVEKECPRKVSCADILALVARDAVAEIKGPSWPVPLGRRDGRVSILNEALTNLPPPFFNITQLIASFASKGLSVKDLVVLSGGHTIGVSHCSSFTNRLYNFTGRNDADPSLDPNYVAALKRRCSPADTTTIVQMDPGSFDDFDVDYFKVVRQRRGLFNSDSELLKNAETRAYVQQHTTLADDPSFAKDFADSMVKMGKIGVLTGAAGEIRRICSAVNYGPRNLCKCRLTNELLQKSCPDAEKIVSDYVREHIPNAPSLAAALLRLHFHDCFVRGCDGSVLLNFTANSPRNKTEKFTPPNTSLRGYDFVDRVKARLESKCPRVVSCADTVALIARDAVVTIGGPNWNVPTGRRDGRVSNGTEILTELPFPTDNITTLTNHFQRKNLDLTDLVALSGAHTIGFAHCTSFSKRLYNFTGKGGQDPTLDKVYANRLKSKCPNLSSTSLVEMDTRGSNETFDVNYYRNVLSKKGLFESDMALLTNPVTNSTVAQFGSGVGNNKFFKQFAISMEKMGRIGVMTGTKGEIRKNCALVN